MKRTQKALSFVLAIVIVFSIIPITASAETIGICGDNLTWVYDKETQTLTISGTGAMYDYSTDSPWSGGCFNYPICNIVINDGVTTIGNYAFYNCYGLTSVAIPDSVITIGAYAFNDCDSLTSIAVDGNNQYYSNDEYGVLFNKDKTTLIQYPIGNTRTSYTIPDSVTIISAYAFYHCDSLTCVMIPDSVILIDAGVFSRCVGITNVSIGKNVKTIGNSAFSGCENLTNIIIPDSVKLIDIGAFRNCEKLKTVTIGIKVAVIENSAFYECSNLTDVYYNSTEKEWDNILIYSFNEPLFNANIHFNTTSNSNDNEDDNISNDSINNNEDSNSSNNCTCNCHKSGISNFFFKFALFFQKLFGSNKYCDCGVVHY